MKAFGKILGLLALGLLLLVVALGFALTHLFDPNDYKDEIRQLARERANLELTLDGDIGWSLFPWLGIELHDATLASADTPDKPFADLRLLGLSVRVLPLLRRKVEMSDIRVDGLDLHLQRDAQGHGNWEGVGRHPQTASSGDAAQSETPPAVEAEQRAEPSRPLSIDIDSLSINDARVLYQDEASGRQYSAEGIELSTGAIREKEAVPFKLSAFFGSNQPVLRARTELQADLRFDRALQRYALENARLSGEASGEPLSGKTLAFTAQGELLADLAAQVAQWNSLKFTANDLRGLGELKIDQLQSEPRLSGGLSIAEFDLRAFLEGIGQPLPAMADSNTLKQVELATRLTAARNSLALDDLKLTVDDSHFEGRIASPDIARRALRVSLKGDTLDLDRYLPPSSADDDSARRQEVQASVAAATGSGTSELPEQPSQQAWNDEKVLPLEHLRKLDAQLDLSLARLTWDKQPLRDARLQASANDGMLDLQRLSGDLDNGRIQASGSIDARSDQPLLKLRSQLSRVPVERVARSKGEPLPLRGLLTLDADLSTRGNSQKAWVDALDGTASFLVDDGVLLDANLEQQLCSAIATLNRKTLADEPRRRDTPFQTLRGSLRIDNGVASNRDLAVRLPGLAVDGAGSVDLRVLGMDYRVGVTVQGERGANADPACQVNEHLADVAWPLRCRGPLELGAKACRIDRDELTRIATRKAGERLGDKLEEKFGDKVSPELKDALRGLFKR